MAQNKIPPILIYGADHIRQIRKRAYQARCDELLGCSELVPLALSEGRLRLPINTTFPDPPDIVLSSDQAKIAIEVSRVTWQRQSQVLAEATKKWPEARVELNPELWVDRQARSAKRRPKGERSGDYRAIKLKGERLDGPGSIGDDHLLATLNALRGAIERKKSRLSAYSTWAPDVWLFLIDDGSPGAWSELLRRTDMRRTVEASCEKTGFKRIFLFQFSGKNLVRLDAD
jgi:hypothetical protein